MQRIAIVLFAISSCLVLLDAPLLAQNEQEDRVYFGDPNRLLVEKLKPIEKAQGAKGALAEVQKWTKAGVKHPAVFDFEGWQHIGLQDWESAVKAFDQALALDANFGDSLTGRGLSYFRMGQFEKALPDFRALAPSAQRSQFIGTCYLRMQRPVGALSFTRNWRDRIDEENLESQIVSCEEQMAKAWELLAADDLAARCITRALKQSPSPDLYVTRAKYMQRQAKYDDAQADIDRAIEAAEPPLFYEVQKFKYLRGANRLSAAKDYAKKLLAKYSEHPELSQVLPSEIEKLEKQIAEGEPPVEKDSTLMIKRQYREAMADKRSAAAVMHASWLISRGHRDYHVRRARALFNLKLEHLALYDLDWALAGDSGANGEVHAMRGYALHDHYQQDSQEIINCYIRAFKYGHQLPSDLVIRALHYKKLQMFEEAIADWKKSEELLPRTANQKTYQSELAELQALASAKKHMAAFLVSDADFKSLTKPMIPTAEIIEKVYQDELAKPFENAIAELTRTQSFVMNRTKRQTEMRMQAATTEELKDAENFPNEFPGGYREVAKHLKPGNTFVIVEFVEPGETRGMSYASIVQVDGDWYWFPKPWRFLVAQPGPTKSSDK